MTASRLGADKTVIPLSISSRFRIDQTRLDAYHQITKSQKCTPAVVHGYPPTNKNTLNGSTVSTFGLILHFSHIALE